MRTPFDVDPDPPDRGGRLGACETNVRGLAAAAADPPTPQIAVLLAGLDPSTLPGTALLDGVIACERLVGWVDSLQQHFLAALARPGAAVPLERVVDAARWTNARPGELAAPDGALEESIDPVSDPRTASAIAAHAARFTAMEVGAALHLSPLTARLRVERALTLVDAMSSTLAAQRRGDLDPLRTRILTEMTAGLPSDLRSRVERSVLRDAGRRTPSQLRAHLTRTIIRLDPSGAADRAEQAKRSRDVHSRPEPDDMASVTALIRADKAATMMWLLNTMADAARGLADDGRDAGQRRADALTDIVDTLASTGVVDLRPSLTTTDSGGSQAVSGARSSPRLVPARPRVCLNIFVAASTLAGADDLPAEMSGQGVITSDLARTIAASATSVRTILVQPDRWSHITRLRRSVRARRAAPEPGCAAQPWTPEGRCTGLRSRPTTT